ncbi:MAG: hypothetical protein KatS3mg115_0653 [Candidatus Poribacteria bacterium]|nr:MAG: hypothetical protein KatS3mg115_0653 [Candidatus Poribacteria bacterium]
MEDTTHPGRAGILAIGWLGALTVLLWSLGCGGRARLEPFPWERFETEVLSELRIRSALLDSLRAQVTLQVQEHGEANEARAVLYFQKPDRLRLDVLDPMGAPVVVIRASQGQLSYLDIRAGKGFLGPLVDRVLQEEFRVSVRITDVQRALLANPFLEGGLDDATVRRENRAVRVVRPTEEGGREEVQVGWQQGEPIVDFWVLRDAQERIVQRVRFWNYRDLGGILFPLDVEIERPAEGVRLRLHAIDPEVNLPLSEATFAHRFPPTAVVRRLSASEETVQGQD